MSKSSRHENNSILDGPFRSALWLVALLVWVCAAPAGEPQSAGIDARAQERVTQLMQAVIQNWRGGGTNTPASTNGMAAGVKLEAAFREASKLMPQRLDLRFGLASALLLQGLQTNGLQLQLKVSDALAVYQEIQALDPAGFDAPLLYAAYTRALGQTNASEVAVQKLTTINPDRTGQYLRVFDAVDRILQMTPPEKPRRNLPRNGGYGIVVLGAGLETNGAVKAKLTGRLEQCLKLARLYRRAPIILTGGNPKGGITEAYAMSVWCRQRWISKKRLILEDRARDTVENALFCAAILQRLGVTHVILVSSASHVRRGLADLQQACLQRGLKLQFETLASKKADMTLDRTRERLGIYRDVLRLSGLWAFPGLQR